MTDRGCVIKMRAWCINLDCNKINVEQVNKEKIKKIKKIKKINRRLGGTN